MCLIIPFLFQFPGIFIIREDVHDVELVVEDYEALRHVGCRDFHLNIEKTTEGKRLRAIDGSETRNAVVKVRVRGQDVFAGVVNVLIMEGGGKGSVDYFLVCRHEEELLVFSGGSEKGCIIEILQTQVVLVVAMIGPYGLLLEKHEGVEAFKNSPAV